MAVGVMCLIDVVETHKTVENDGDTRKPFEEKRFWLSSSCKTALGIILSHTIAAPSRSCESAHTTSEPELQRRLGLRYR